MDQEMPPDSTLRFRHNASRPCAVSDTDTDRQLVQSSTKVAKKSRSSRSDSGCAKSKISNRKRGRIRMGKKRRAEDDESMGCLVTITAILSILIVGGFVYLTYLIVVVDPSSQNHLPLLQKLINSMAAMKGNWTLETGGNDFTVASEGNHDPIPLPPSPIYNIPNSMPHIGDKSDEYARLRKDWDEKYPPNSPERSVPAVKKLVASGNVLSSIYSKMRPPPFPPISAEQEATPERKEDREWDYDVYNCPDKPPPGYPREYKTIDILKHWPPTQNLPVGKYCHHQTNSSCVDGEETSPVVAHLGLCVFDYSRDYEKAMRYRSNEVPFVVRNDPSVAETVERWNDDSYRRKLFGNLHHRNFSDEDIKKDSYNATNDVLHRAERSITNQVLFRHSKKSKKKKPNSFTSSYKEQTEESTEMQDQSPKGGLSPPMPPATKLVPMTYDRWHELAIEKEVNSVIDNETGIQYFDANQKGNDSLFYYYFRLVGCGEKEGCERNSTEYLFDEMPFFQPRRSSKQVPNQESEKTELSSSDSTAESLYLVQAEKQRGIHCRFGMPGMIAANHYDASRNAIVVLGGSRRYIVSRPNQCPNLGLYPTGHPSARHSRVDWTTAFDDYRKLEDFEGPLAQSDDPSWIEYRKSLSLLANNARSTEVVLQAGDVLYLPSYWFHYIVSLTTNMQCNTRSGRDGRDDQTMGDCGFPPPKNQK